MVINTKHKQSVVHAAVNRSFLSKFTSRTYMQLCAVFYIKATEILAHSVGVAFNPTPTYTDMKLLNEDTQRVYNSKQHSVIRLIYKELFLIHFG